MNFLYTVMKASLMLSRSVTAIGATVVVIYGVATFIKDQRERKVPRLPKQR
jgi:hypothetical protein